MDDSTNRETMELVMVLRDHRTIVNALKEASAGAKTLADETARQREEVEKLDLAYRRLLRTIERVNKASASGTSGANADAPAGSVNRFATAPNTGGSRFREQQQRASAGRSGGRPSNGGSRFQSSRPGRAPKSPYPKGPYQNLRNLQDLYERAQSEGAPGDVLEDLKLKLKNAQGRVNNLNQSPWQNLMKAVLTSRFSMGANGFGIQPLIGRTLAAMGIGGAAAGPIALAVSGMNNLVKGAIRAGLALAAMADRSARVTSLFTQLQVMTGGTGAQTGLLGSLGISGSASRGVLDRITSDPVAMGVAARMGVSAIPGPYGTVNSADVTLRLVEQLRKESGEQQVRDARILGLDGFGGLLRISNAQFQLLKRDSVFRAQIYGPAQQRTAADFGASRDRLRDQIQDLQTQFSSPLMRRVTSWNNDIADMVKGFNRSKPDFENLWHFFGMLGKITHPELWIGMDLTHRIAQHLRGQGNDDPQNEQTQATKELNASIRRLTRSMEMTERGQRAVPEALRGSVSFHLALQSGALPTGIM